MVSDIGSQRQLRGSCREVHRVSGMEMRDMFQRHLGGEMVKVQEMLR